MKIFISFDWTNDKHYRFLLNAWNNNPSFPIDFIDGSSPEINSWNITRIKAALTTKIRQAHCTLVIVGAEASKIHKDKQLIGYNNWLDFEIAKSKEAGNTLIGVKVNSRYTSPTELLGSFAIWAKSFERDPIVTAINEAKKRI
jgi:hypothetical protein